MRGRGGVDEELREGREGEGRGETKSMTIPICMDSTRISFSATNICGTMSKRTVLTYKS